MKKINGIIMQYFEWYMDCHQNLWNQIRENAEKARKALELSAFSIQEYE